jgi:sulfofructose kinase
MDQRIDILGLGSAAVDEILYVETYPLPDTKIRVARRERRCGGLTATALVAAARLGARCSYAGRLGLDHNSHLVEENFALEQIDTSHAPRGVENGMVTSTIVVAMATGTRNIFSRTSGLTGAHEGAPSESVIRNSRALLVDHHGIPGAIRACRIARETGIPVVADLERADDARFYELLAVVDHLILSEEFAARITGCKTARAAIGKLWSPERAVIIVTCGAEGCWFAESADTPRKFPAFRVSARDTAGCGDVFHGAYVAGLAFGMRLIQRLRFASASAALYASRPGDDRIPRREEVRAFREIARFESMPT